MKDIPVIGGIPKILVKLPHLHIFRPLTYLIRLPMTNQPSQQITQRSRHEVHYHKKSNVFVVLGQY